MKNKTDFFIALALLVICAVAWQQIRLLPESASAEFFRPASFPTGVTVLLAVLACILLVRSFLVRGRASWPERPVLLKVLLMILLVLGYVAGFVGLGEYAYDALWPGRHGLLFRHPGFSGAGPGAHRLSQPLAHPADRGPDDRFSVLGLRPFV